jgi:hypothetical protein
MNDTIGGGVGAIVVGALLVELVDVATSVGIAEAAVLSVIVGEGAVPNGVASQEADGGSTQRRHPRSN